MVRFAGADGATYRDKALAAGAVAYFQKLVDYGKPLEPIIRILGIEAQ